MEKFYTSVDMDKVVDRVVDKVVDKFVVKVVYDKYWANQISSSDEEDALSDIEYDPFTESKIEHPLPDDKN